MKKVEENEQNTFFSTKEPESSAKSCQYVLENNNVDWSYQKKTVKFCLIFHQKNNISESKNPTTTPPPMLFGTDLLFLKVGISIKLWGSLGIRHGVDHHYIQFIQPMTSYWNMKDMDRSRPYL